MTTSDAESKWPCFFCGSMRAHFAARAGGGLSTVPACEAHKDRPPPTPPPAREPTTLDAMRAATEAVAAACAKAFEDGERSERKRLESLIADKVAGLSRSFGMDDPWIQALLSLSDDLRNAPAASDPPVAPAEATGTTDGGPLPPDVDTSGLADSAARTSAPFGDPERPKPACEHGTPYPKACHPCFVEWGRELQRVVLPNDKPARPIGGPRTGAPFEAMAEADASPWLAPLRAWLAHAEARHPEGPDGMRSLVEEVGEVASAMRRETPERVREELLDVAVVALRWWMQVEPPDAADKTGPWPDPENIRWKQVL